MIQPPAVYTCRITLNSEMLGSQPANEDVHTNYIASRIPDGRTTAFDAITGSNGHKDGDLERLLIKEAVNKAQHDKNTKFKQLIKELLENPSTSAKVQEHAVGLFNKIPLGDPRLDNEIARLGVAAGFGPDGEPEADTLKGRTVFLRDELGRPVLRDYVLRGFFKESWRANKAMKGSLSSALKAGPTTIDRFLFVEGAGTHRDKRYIVINMPHGTSNDLPLYERPLRASTAAGPRVALASSEVVPAKSYFDFRLINLNPTAISQELLEEWLNYGRWMGLGQWRTGSHGQFSYKLRPYEGKTLFHGNEEGDGAEV